LYKTPKGVELGGKKAVGKGKTYIRQGEVKGNSKKKEGKDKRRRGKGKKGSRGKAPTMTGGRNSNGGEGGL